MTVVEAFVLFPSSSSCFSVDLLVCFLPVCLRLQEDSKAAVTVIKVTPGSPTGLVVAAPWSSRSVYPAACWLLFLLAVTCELWSSEETP